MRLPIHLRWVRPLSDMRRGWRRSPASLLPPDPGEGSNVSSVRRFRNSCRSYRRPGAIRPAALPCDCGRPRKAAARARSFSAEPPFRSRVVVLHGGAKFHSSSKTASFLGNVAEKPALRTREASDHVASSAGRGGIAGICHFLSRGCASQPHDVCRQGFHVLRALSRQPWVFRPQALPFARAPARGEIAKRCRIGGKHRPSARDEPNWSKAVRRSGAGQIAGGTDLRPVGERKRFRGPHGAAACGERNAALAHSNSDRARG